MYNILKYLQQSKQTYLSDFSVSRSIFPSAPQAWII